MRMYAREIARFTQGMSVALDDNALPMTTARRVYNFDTKRGALTDGLGISAYEVGGEALPPLPAEPECVWQYTRADEGERDDRLVAYAGGVLYELPLYGTRVWTRLDGSSFRARPAAINYRLNSATCCS